MSSGMKKGYTIDGCECPSCGSVKTRSRRAGFDGMGNRIRVRECESCDSSFTTVEAPAEFVFGSMDTTKIDRDRERRVKRAGPDHVSKQFVPKSGLGYLRVSVTVFDPPRPNTCRRGLHELTDDNVLINKSREGSRKCKACAHETTRRYREQCRDYIRANARRMYHERKARLALESKPAA